jgi:hypothetical protein
MKMRGKKAVIVFSLVEESAEKSNEEIEREIMEELSMEPARIPWLKEVEKVTVTEAWIPENEKRKSSSHRPKKKLIRRGTILSGGEEHEKNGDFRAFVDSPGGRGSASVHFRASWCDSKYSI